MRTDATLTRRLARRAFVAKAANAFEAVRLKLVALYERLSDQAARALLAEVIARLADAPDEAATLDLLRGLDLAALAGAALPASDLNDLNEALYLAGAVDSALSPNPSLPGGEGGGCASASARPITAPWS